MIKKVFLLADHCVITKTRLINTSDKFYGKWFYMKKHVTSAKTTSISFKDDWEHGIGLGLNKSTPLNGVTELEEYHKLPGLLQKRYTYQYLSNKCSMAKEIADKAAKLNVNQVLNPLAFKVISDTVRIRHNKQVLQTDNDAKVMERRTRCLIRCRKANLRQLSLEDGDLTKAICREFGIKMVADEPRRYEAPNPEMEQIKKEVQSMKLRKIKAFKEDMSEARVAFFRDKKERLKEIEDDLGAIHLSIEEVYNEVIADRQDRAMLPIYREKYGWFDREKQLKIYYDKLRADKKEARERQQRR